MHVVFNMSYVLHDSKDTIWHVIRSKFHRHFHAFIYSQYLKLLGLKISARRKH